MKKLLILLLLAIPYGVDFAPPAPAVYPQVMPTLGFCVADTTLITEVRMKLDEISTEKWDNLEIKTALNREFLSKTRNYLLLTTIDSTTISTTTARPEYTLPATFNAAFLIFVNRGGGRWEPVKPVGEDLKQKVQTAEMTWYFTFKTQIRFSGPPTTSGQKIYLWYFARGTAMAFTGTECPLDDEDEPIIVDGSVGQLLRKLKDPNSRQAGAEYKALSKEAAEDAMRSKILYLLAQNEGLLQYIPKALRDQAEK